MFLIDLFRQKRPLEIEQVSGFMLMGCAAVLFTSPHTSSLMWLSALWGIAQLANLLAVLYLVCGFLLCLETNSGFNAYAVLTAPIAIYGALLISYSITNGSTFFAGVTFCAFWVFMQFAHSQVQEVRAWIKP